MRTTTLIALIGTTAAAATLEADCTSASSTTCTYELCHSAKPLPDDKTYKACTPFQTVQTTPEGLCQYGTDDDQASCTKSMCDGKTWYNCTNRWVGQPLFKLWMEQSFKDAPSEPDAIAIQTKIGKELTAAKAAVISTAATLDSAKKAQDHAMALTDAAKKTAALAITQPKLYAAEGDHHHAGLKVKVLQEWWDWAYKYMDNLWQDNNSQPQFYKWMKYSIINSTLKTDAIAAQAKLVTQLQAAQKNHSTASAKWTIAQKTLETDKHLLAAATKVHTQMANSASNTLLAKALQKEQESKRLATFWGNANSVAYKKSSELNSWVRFGKNAIRNEWNDTQPWQTTWYKNLCDTTKETTEADMQAFQDATIANLKSTKAKKLTKNNEDKINQLEIRKTYGAAILANTYQAHQITWMSAKINGSALKSDAEKIQAANVKALKDHQATLKTTTAAAEKAKLNDQIEFEEKQVKEGTKDLKNEDNNTRWTKNKKAADAAAGKKAFFLKQSRMMSKNVAEYNLHAAQKKAEQSTHLVAQQKKDMGLKDCAIQLPGDNNYDECKTYAATLKGYEKNVTDDAEAVKLAEANVKYIEAHGGSTPIIIGCVAGALVLIGGVCFWKYKQNAKKSQNSETAEPAELPIEFATDDCYKAFVDQEL